MTKSNTSSQFDKDSIIDVTDASFRIDLNTQLKKYSKGVPFWIHQYVYSFSEINSATSEQKKFYGVFKNFFLSGFYLDLEGNLNYAFILLFDLLNEYEIHKDISKLERQLKILGQCYPKTKSYGVSFLMEIMDTIGNTEEFPRKNEYNRYFHHYYISEYELWRLGNKYKTKLNLKYEEVNILNKIWNTNNIFLDIDFCSVQIIKLYISVIKELKATYILNKTSLDAQFNAIADAVVRKQFNFRIGNPNYIFYINSLCIEIYNHIFKLCENTVREVYAHKRKLNTDTPFENDKIKLVYEDRIISKVSTILTHLIPKISPPNKTTEIKLNAININRWKIQIEKLTKNYHDNSESFIDSILTLVKLNRNNKTFEKIYFEALKFIVDYDKISALTLYIHYINHILNYDTDTYKQILKNLQNRLFNTQEQFYDFQCILNTYIDDRDLNKAIIGIRNINEIKRKKIQLNTTYIKEVQEQHSETVELLNEYLKDDVEENNHSLKSHDLKREESNLEISSTGEVLAFSSIASNLSFTPIHLSVLELFSKSDFSVPDCELEVFAKSKGIFKNQLIESINEICYDFLDDVLIEVEDDFYTMNTNYFQKITAK